LTENKFVKKIEKQKESKTKARRLGVTQNKFFFVCKKETLYIQTTDGFFNFYSSN